MNNVLLSLLYLIPVISYIVLIFKPSFKNRSLVETLTSLVFSIILFFSLGRLDAIKYKLLDWGELFNTNLVIELNLTPTSLVFILMLCAHKLSRALRYKEVDSINFLLELVLVSSGNIFTLSMIFILRALREVFITKKGNLLLVATSLMVFSLVSILSNPLINNLATIELALVDKWLLYLVGFTVLSLLFPIFRFGIKEESNIDKTIIAAFLLITFKPMIRSELELITIIISFLILFSLNNVIKSLLTKNINETYDYVTTAFLLFSMPAILLAKMGLGLFHILFTLIFYFILKVQVLNGQDEVSGRTQIVFNDNPFKVITLTISSLCLIGLPLTESYFFSTKIISNYAVFYGHFLVELISYFILICSTIAIVNVFFMNVSFEKEREVDWSIDNKSELIFTVLTVLCFISFSFLNLPDYLSSNNALWTSNFLLDVSGEIINGSLIRQSENVIIVITTLITVLLSIYSYFLVVNKKIQKTQELINKQIAKASKSLERVYLISETIINKKVSFIKYISTRIEKIISNGISLFESVVHSLTLMSKQQQIAGVNNQLIFGLFILVVLLSLVIKGF